MKIINLTKKNIDYKDYVKRSAVETDFDTVIDEDCILMDNGVIKAVYKILDFPDQEIVAALHKIKYPVTERTGGLKTTSRIFGFAPRVALRKDYCSSTSLAETNPVEHKIVCDYAKRVEAIYKDTDPTVYNKHKATTDEKIRKDYKMENTVFTSGIINKNNPLKYHLDSGNFETVYSCMLGFKYNIEGGYLAFPEYGIALKISNNSCTIFDGQSILHGVTPIKRVSEDAYRFTVVYYSLKNIWQCLPINEEIARIRNLKLKRELKRAGINDEPEAETLGDVR